MKLAGLIDDGAQNSANSLEIPQNVVKDEDHTDVEDPPEQMTDEDLDSVELRLAHHLQQVLGTDAGQEFAAALRNRNGGILEEEDLFGAFWRSVWTSETTDNADDIVDKKRPQTNSPTST